MTSNEIQPPVRGAQANAKFWSGNDIREAFLRFFEGKGHRRVRSSSLVPHGEATPLFTKAGMKQIKDVFPCPQKREYTRVTPPTKCVRSPRQTNKLYKI